MMSCCLSKVVSIWDWDRFSGDDPMGMMSVDIGELAEAAFKQGNGPADEEEVKGVLVPGYAKGAGNNFNVENCEGCENASGHITVQFNVALLYVHSGIVDEEMAPEVVKARLAARGKCPQQYEWNEHNVAGSTCDLCKKTFSEGFNCCGGGHYVCLACVK